MIKFDKKFTKLGNSVALLVPNDIKRTIEFLTEKNIKDCKAILSFDGKKIIIEIEELNK